jgi:DNA-binding MarR family transcriptional regulator
MSPIQTPPPEVYLPPSEEGHFNPRVPGIDYGVLDELLGYSVRRAQILMYEDFIASLASWQVTPPRFSAMVVIARNPGLKLTELARILGIARSGAVALIDSLAELAYVERRPSPTDRRALGLFLTTQGEADLPHIIDAVKAHDRRATQTLSPLEFAQLHELLSRLMPAASGPSEAQP